LLNVRPLFRLQNVLQRRLAAFVFHVEFGALLRPDERVDALRFFAAMPIEHQIPSDGEKPGFKFPLAVVLMAAFEYPKPRFLKKIFGPFAIGGEMQQVTEQAKLILLDKLVKQFRIAALQTARKCFCIITHEGGKAYRGGYPRRAGSYRDLKDRVHSELYTG